MHTISPQKSWGCAALLAIVSSAPALCGADTAVDRQIINPLGLSQDTLQALEAHKQKQIQAAKAWKVFHDFQFSDQYEESGITFEHHPVDDAAKNYKAVHYDHGNGLAVADVDGDGRLDIYFVNQLGGNQLWRNLGHGKFENITAAAGVGLEDKICVTASFADIDNDGLPDLFVTTVRMGNFLFKNLGHGRFKDITQESGLGGGQATALHSSGAVFFDFNNDGLLDLFVANVGVYTTNDKGRGGFYLGGRDAFKAGISPPAASKVSCTRTWVAENSKTFPRRWVWNIAAGAGTPRFAI